ncbi:MAG: hypothetical protein WBB66_06120, partial [Candidatus Omnitrophota bacterium]
AVLPRHAPALANLLMRGSPFFHISATTARARAPTASQGRQVARGLGDNIHVRNFVFDTEKDPIDLQAEWFKEFLKGLGPFLEEFVGAAAGDPRARLFIRLPKVVDDEAMLREKLEAEIQNILNSLHPLFVELDAKGRPKTITLDDGRVVPKINEDLFLSMRSKILIFDEDITGMEQLNNQANLMLDGLVAEGDRYDKGDIGGEKPPEINEMIAYWLSLTSANLEFRNMKPEMVATAIAKLLAGDNYIRASEIWEDAADSMAAWKAVVESL